MKKWFVIILLIVIAGAAYAERGLIRSVVSTGEKPNVSAVNYQPATVEVPANTATNIAPGEEPVEPATNSGANTNTTTPTNNEATTSTASLPSEYNLAVPFTSQAPLGNWDEVHEETCEEAAVLMSAYYYQGKPAGQIDPNEADKALLQIVDFENTLFGFYKDTTAAQTAVLIESEFNLSYALVTDPTVDQLKQELVAGHPVIVPTAGRMLGNPHFTGAGPLYHMLVLKGYTKDGFITNDPGTHLGADYFYSFDTIMNAMHDWNNGDVDNGAKVVIVVKP